MAVITYTAKRALIPGHSVANNYTLEFGLASSEPNDNVIATDHLALDGSKSTFFSRVDVTKAISTNGRSDYLQWLEFLRSVADGSVFTFDEYGTVAVPGNPVSVKLEGGYRQRRVTYNDIYSFAFTIKYTSYT